MQFIAHDRTGEFTVWRVSSSIIKAAVAADWACPACFFAMPYQQGMVFIEHGDIRREVIHEKRLAGGVAIYFRCQTRAFQEAAGISVDDEDGLVAGIEYYAVGRLLADAVDSQQLPA